MRYLDIIYGNKIIFNQIRKPKKKPVLLELAQ